MVDYVLLRLGMSGLVGSVIFGCVSVWQVRLGTFRCGELRSVAFSYGRLGGLVYVVFR